MHVCERECVSNIDIQRECVCESEECTERERAQRETQRESVFVCQRECVSERECVLGQRGSVHTHHTLREEHSVALFVARVLDEHRDSGAGSGAGFRVQGSGFMVQGLGSGV